MTNPSSSMMASPRSLSPCSEAERAYRATCTLPAMPKKCPDCAGKVKLCHINIETNESVIMCPDTKCRVPDNMHRGVQIASAGLWMIFAGGSR